MKTAADRYNNRAQYRQWIIEAAQRYGVPSDLALAIAQRETGTRQYDHSGQVIRGAAGELGIMQVMPGNANGRVLRDPYANIQAGVDYLSEMFKRFGTWPLAVAAYNAGPGRLEQYLAGKQRLPKETLDYTRIVTGQSVAAEPGAGDFAKVRGGTTPSKAAAPDTLSQKQMLAIGLFAAAVLVLWSS